MAESSMRCQPATETIGIMSLTLFNPSEILQQVSEHWYLTADGDPHGLALYSRHYSRYHYLFVGPGEKLVLVSATGDAMFVWRKFIDDSGQRGVNCAVFRNESPVKSSDLIREAMRIAWQRWPGERLYTYVKAKAIRSSNPGYCFQCAGWRKCGITKTREFQILECL